MIIREIYSYCKEGVNQTRYNGNVLLGVLSGPKFGLCVSNLIGDLKISGNPLSSFSFFFEGSFRFFWEYDTMHNCTIISFFAASTRYRERDLTGVPSAPDYVGQVAVPCLLHRLIRQRSQGVGTRIDYSGLIVKLSLVVP
jgi:hypothetical protein